MTHENHVEREQPSNKELIISSGHMMRPEDIAAIRNYIDECDENDVSINFSKLIADVYNQRLANQDKTGKYFDAIDDGPYMAAHGDVIGFMRKDQVMKHIDDLLDQVSPYVADRIVAIMSPAALATDYNNGKPTQPDLRVKELGQTFLNDHLGELLAAGANPNKLAKNLTPDQVRENKDLLIEHGASRLKANKRLALAALRGQKDS
jgi:hypothetical protein